MGISCGLVVACAWVVVRSAGGVTLTVELDQSLLTRPDELQSAIAELYQEADHALDNQVRPVRQYTQQPQHANGNGGYNNPRRNGGNANNSGGNTSGATSRNTASGGTSGGASGGGASGGGMTQSQRRAIEAICRRLNIDPAAEAQQQFGFNYQQMSVRDASRMIDHIKSLQSSGRNGG